MASSAPREPHPPLVLDLPDEAAMAALARRLADLARPGDTIALDGDLGTGKTSFARAFIRARASASGGAVGEVPSPTFTLVQIYDLPGGAIWHADLYRIGDPSEAIELGLEDASTEGILLVEWPDRAPGALDPDRLRIAISFGVADDERIVEIEGGLSWRDRMARLAEAVA
ncbi:MAG: tRNA (adenosine(37)-N6)-threonylcarbamoyltransferase complex ATPase subunit type 1 TsaE [Rhodospirillaceae bacterium]|nr:tRNA (adenosine(37)-N6)-threonylcarbamoyltransferase complex ATPase subunit type 1 TsaE [Rhodospirillaceae bacterium]